MSASTIHVAGREWFGAVFQEPLTSSTRRNFSKNYATPIFRRTDRPQPRLALAAILITENARLPQAIATQPVRTKQAWEIFVDRADRLPFRYRSPNQPVHLLH